MWYLVINLLFLVLGLIFGSFFNVVIYRLPKKDLSIFKPERSFCPNCKAQIKWFDNIPIFSYLFLRGKCRYCKEKISLRYPLVEGITGISFLLNSIFFPIGQAIFLCLLSSGLIITSFIDLDNYLIPDSGIILIAAGSFGWSTIRGNFPFNLLDALIILAIFSLFFFIANKFKKDSFGFGDVELFSCLALGISLIGTLFAVLIASLAGIVYYLIISRKNGSKNKLLPFGPFISLGGYIVFFVLDVINNFYRIT